MTPEQFFEEQIISGSKLPKERRRYTYLDVVKLAEVYGNQEWNAALDAAAESAITKWGQSAVKVDKHSILKLKR